MVSSFKSLLAGLSLVSLALAFKPPLVPPPAPSPAPSTGDVSATQNATTDELPPVDPGTVAETKVTANVTDVAETEVPSNETEATAPTSPSMTSSPEACEKMCEYKNATHSCSDRMQWVSEHKAKNDTDPKQSAHEIVASECDFCAGCTVKFAFAQEKSEVDLEAEWDGDEEETTSGEDPCDKLCEYKDAKHSCGVRMQWVSTHEAKNETDPKQSAHDTVASECDFCADCTVKVAFADEESEVALEAEFDGEEDAETSEPENACDKMCEVKGLSASCTDRMIWVGTHEAENASDPKQAAFDLIVSECDICSKCMLEDAFPADWNASMATVEDLGPCSKMCEMKGVAANCSDRMWWTSTHQTDWAGDDAQTKAHETVLGQCDVCADCKFEDVFGKQDAAEGEAAGANATGENAAEEAVESAAEIVEPSAPAVAVEPEIKEGSTEENSSHEEGNSTAEASADACSQVCELEGSSGNCTDRIQWAIKYVTHWQPNALQEAVKKVATECDVCAACEPDENMIAGMNETEEKFEDITDANELLGPKVAEGKGFFWPALCAAFVSMGLLIGAALRQRSPVVVASEMDMLLPSPDV